VLCCAHASLQLLLQTDQPCTDCAPLPLLLLLLLSLLQCAIYGNFSAPKAQEIVVSRGRVLELIRPGDNGRLQVLLSTDVFGVIRSLAAFRLTGAQRDYVIVGSDSGRIVILDYNKDKNTFVKVGGTVEQQGCRTVQQCGMLASSSSGDMSITSSSSSSKQERWQGQAQLALQAVLQAVHCCSSVLSMWHALLLMSG
jgi:hypothetical protein